MRRLRWMLPAVIALGAALLASRGHGRHLPAHPEHPSPVPIDESARQLRERSTPVKLHAARPGARTGAPEPGLLPRDPFLAALPVSPDQPIVVFEANALRNSRLGERLVACVQARNPGGLATFERATGVDLLRDVDRVAYLGDAAVISGFFERVRWDALGPAEPYGREGRIYRDGNLFVSAWRDQILVFSPGEASARLALDQLEGRVPIPEDGIPEDMAHGEIYGVLPGAAARALLGRADRSLADDLAGVVSRLEVHVEAMQDVAAVVRIRTDDAAGKASLAASIGRSLAAARLEARATGDEPLTAVLDGATIRAGPGELSVQVTVPASRLEGWLHGCGDGASAPAH